MSAAHLTALSETLSAIPSTEVDVPEISMAVVLQEANDLLIQVRDATVWSRLEAIGVSSAARENLETALGAARAAQSQWTVARDRQKSDAQRQRELRGEALRLDLLAASRFNLREDRVALGTLSAISQGEGVADLIQDLNDLALLIDQKAASFARDKTFDAAKRSEEARSLSSEIAAGMSGERAATDQASAVDLRNRAYTYLDDQVSALREAGRYAFRNDEKMRKRFASEYLRRQRRRINNEKQAVAAPSGE